MGFLDKIKNLASKNADKVETAIDKAGDIVDQKTQGKYASQVEQGSGSGQEGRRQDGSANTLTHGQTLCLR